ncbi:hypothetical protein WKR88_20280 [Trinickia caryophylli]|uniref:hypothetical protein n=1 Tax=Trinickia caryophylli TaxID=28094 RepID=UPI00111BCF06|nr:hypothetical protein [Trinickia caryophylli]TRX14138.1 hypothetical protein FNF07_22715 [Trinickia caryophylli]WQE13960.1 hypothetical protein U0034_24920 [Trinickia caryophylli]
MKRMTVAPADTKIPATFTSCPDGWRFVTTPPSSLASQMHLVNRADELLAGSLPLSYASTSPESNPVPYRHSLSTCCHEWPWSDGR